MKKTKKILLAMASFLTVSMAATLIFTNHSNLNQAFSSEDGAVWGHYTAVAPTDDNPGCKEFWISCETHEVLFESPASSNVIERGAPTLDEINSWKNDDTNRYIYPLSEGLTFAVFADVQLTGEENISGESVTNQGTTANAPLALKNHLQFIKNQNIDVVLMDGDICNQANAYYYAYFNKIVKEVFGEDESKYPEFVWNMGNHEWWWGITEKPSGNAVGLFKENARINSANLVRESAVKYSLFPTETIPSYYKVIKGIPFMVVSGENASGFIGDELYSELESWLDEIKNLNSVKNGGPIFIQYHCPLSTTMTHGQGSSNYATPLEQLLKDTPNAVVFTGDTHFPGINERSINQVNFTSINLGSSSYSRMVDQSAVICDDYDNVGGGSKTAGLGDIPLDNIAYKHAYTPTIQVAHVSGDNSFTIDRYFSQDNGTGKSVGKQWQFAPIHSKNDFTYTNARFQNTKTAQDLYGATGLSWDNGDTVSFGVNEETHQMTVKFKDVLNYHFCEHYRISVNGKIYDECSAYYKYLDQREDNYFVLKDVPSAATYNVTVTAYDFYDNPSLNTLSSSTNDPNNAIDPIDYHATDVYTDIQVRNCLTDTADEESHSSIEYYYKGKNTYRYGAILTRLVYDSGDSCQDYLTLQNQINARPVVKLAAKNLSNEDLVVGLTVVDGNGTWKTDFGGDVQKTVKAGDWVKLEWDLKELFGMTSRKEMSHIGLKAKLNNASADGYEMNFLIDNIDIAGEGELPTYRGKSFAAGSDIKFDPVPSTTGKIIIDLLIQNGVDKYFSFALLDTSNWDNYFGYFEFNYAGQKKWGGEYEGITLYSLPDDYLRIEIDFAKVTQISSTNIKPTVVNELYVHKSWNDATGYVDVNPTDAPDPVVIRGKTFAAGVDCTTDLKGEDIRYVATDTLVFDVKFTSGSGTSLNVMLGHGWNFYFGYFKIFADGTLANAYDGVTIKALNDGYFRVSFELSKVTKVNDKPAPTDYVNLVHIRGGWTDGSEYIDINPKV